MQLDAKAVEGILHFDPVQIVITIIAVAVGWSRVKVIIESHSKWMEKHDKECVEYKKQTAEGVTVMKENLIKLTMMSEIQGKDVTELKVIRDAIMMSPPRVRRAVRATRKK